MLKRYNNIDFVLKLSAEDGIKLINSAREKELEEILYRRWLVDYSHMDIKTFISFDEYKKKFFVKLVDNRSMDDVLKEAEEISLKISQKRGEE